MNIPFHAAGRGVSKRETTEAWSAMAVACVSGKRIPLGSHGRELTPRLGYILPLPAWSSPFPARHEGGKQIRCVPEEELWRRHKGGVVGVFTGHALPSNVRPTEVGEGGRGPARHPSLKAGRSSFVHLLPTVLCVPAHQDP
jgi:hypothetical protein